MSLELDLFTFDCSDPIPVATFWAAALGYELEPPSEAVGVFVRDPSSRVRKIYFQRVPESKVAKNRVHLDVRPDGSMAAEVTRLTELGATLRGHVEEGGSFWTQMRDPEGNEFCVLRGPQDGWSRDEL